MLLRYVLKRILIFIPTLFAISLVIFFLNKYAPGDPVEILIGGSDSKTGSMSDMRSSEALYDSKRKELKLNLPAFYFSFTSKAYSDTLHKIIRPTHQETLSRLADKYGNWENTQAYYQAITRFKTVVFEIEKDSLNPDALIAMRNKTLELYKHYQDKKITNRLNIISKAIQTTSSTKVVLAEFTQLKAAYNQLKNEPTTWKKYIPTVHWYGTNNQYHIWVFGDKPWIKKSKDILTVSNQELSKSSKILSFETEKNGYYKILPSFDLVANNGRKTEIDVQKYQLFEIEVNNRKTVYSPKDILEKEIIIQVDESGTLPISIIAKPIVSTYKLKYNYDLEITKLLNYHPDKLSGGFVRFDFGNSYKSQKPVSTIIKDSLYWTMLLSFLSILITYLISIPIGVFSARKKGSKADNIISTFLFMLYSLPNFWIATLLIVFVGTELGWFPIFGVGEVADDASMWETLRIRSYHLFLPLLCWTYPSLAFLSRQMRGGMLAVLRQDFIRTARAKGLEEKKVIWKHAFRNSLLPIITLFAGVFPRMISGSIVIEVIFSIPGMGSTMLNAIDAKDFPLVFTIVMFSAILTIIGYLIADILYAIVDPRITYK